MAARLRLRPLGIETVAVYSQADEEALPVQLATQAVCIGPARASDSYLNQEALLTVAQFTGCDGVHPGYGFLSENGEFADACARQGLAFIGPSGDAIRRAGSKSAAKTLMKQAGVPVTPGSDGPVDSVEAAPGCGQGRGLSGAPQGFRRRRWPGHPPGLPGRGATRGLRKRPGRSRCLFRQRGDVSGKADPPAPAH